MNDRKNTIWSWMRSEQEAVRTKARNMNEKILTTTNDAMTLQIIKRLDRKYTERQYHRKMPAKAIETNSIKGKNCQCYEK